VLGGDGWNGNLGRVRNSSDRLFPGAEWFLLEGLSNYLPSATQEKREQPVCVVCGMRDESLNRGMYLNLSMEVT